MKLNGIDIFSGAGGMSIGAVLAGIKVDLAIEINKYAVETFHHNHPNTKIINADISKISLDSEYIKPFVLFGGPPCQGFSVSNKKTRSLSNLNNELFHEFVKKIQELSPTWFVFENVEGILSFQNGMVVKLLKDEVEKLGYKVSIQTILASDYGVPQNRNRFFMIGNRIGVDYLFPEKTDRKITVHEAISDLPTLSNGAMIDILPYKDDKASEYALLMRRNSKYSTQNYVSKNKDYVIERFKTIKQGQNWKSIPKYLMHNYSKIDNCHNSIYKRLNPEIPSVVIANYRKNMLIHPYEDRGLSVREAARLQSFPDDFTFKGSISHQQQQIGNAVPPLLAKAIFQQIIKLS
jgi:DNA (cytosine-5)-methyltransferase 1